MITRQTISQALQTIAANTIGSQKTATLQDIYIYLGIPQNPANSYKISQILKDMNIRPLTQNHSRYRRYLLPHNLTPE